MSNAVCSRKGAGALRIARRDCNHFNAAYVFGGFKDGQGGDARSAEQPDAQRHLNPYVSWANSCACSQAACLTGFLELFQAASISGAKAFNSASVASLAVRTVSSR